MFAGAAAALAVLAWLLVPWAWVPGGHLVPVRPDQVFTAAQLRRSAAYADGQRHLAWAALAGSVGITLLLGLTPAGARATRLLPGPWWLRAALATLLVVGLGTLVTLPFAWEMRTADLREGLTRQGAAGWWRDQGASLLVAWVTATVIALVFLVAARRSPRRWPLWAGLAGALLTVAGSWVYPVAVEPLFNHFTPLPAGPLRSGILRLASVEHVSISEVLVADASRRTTTLNAYVSGFGSTRRVVLYDTLVTGVPRREALVVVAHELGHARHRDVVLGTALGALGVLTGGGLLGLALGRRGLLRRAGLGGVEGGADAAAVPLVLALVSAATVLASPAQSAVSRAIEARADRASLQATRDYVGFERMQRELALRSLSAAPGPAWSQLWFGSHPTTLERIGLARALERRP